MGKENSFVFYTKYADALRCLTSAQQGQILMACISYVTTGNVPEIRNQSASMLFKLIRQDIDEDKRKYAEVCEKRRQNVQKRWNTDEYNSIQMNTNEYKRIQTHTNDTDKDKDKDKDIYKGIYTRTRAKTKFSNFDERDPAETIARIGGTL